MVSLQGCVKAPKLLQSSPGRVPESSAVRHSPQTSKHSRPLKITGTSVSSQKENKERWGIILNHLIVNKPPDVSSKPTEKRGLQMVSVNLLSSGSNLKDKLFELTQNPSRAQDQDEGVAGRNEREQNLLR